MDGIGVIVEVDSKLGCGTVGEEKGGICWEICCLVFEADLGLEG